jgi:Ca2+-binding RTX toxin-like protein
MFESLESRTLLSVSLSKTTLTITGSPGKDTILVANKSSTEVQVTGASKSPAVYKAKDFAGFVLVINGGDGNDTITINADVAYTSATISGGKGSDKIQGGSKVDAIDGGDDPDRISGGDGADIALINVGQVHIVRQQVFRNGRPVLVNGKPVFQNIPVPFNDKDAYDMGKGNDTLRIQGTEKADRIFLERIILKDGTKALQLNGAGKSVITVKKNELIEVNALGGNDRIFVRPSTNLFGKINLDGGKGLDTFVGDFEDLDGTKTPVHIEFTVEPN